MKESIGKILKGYDLFREKYAAGEQSLMRTLSEEGQSPEIMLLSCSDSRVDPSLILQCDPGDLFTIRNVASLVPPYEKDGAWHGTSAALEFGTRALKVKHLIIMGHSQCGGIKALMGEGPDFQSDFIQNWVSIIDPKEMKNLSCEEAVKKSLNISYENCLTFPWIRERVEKNELKIHLWFFEIKTANLFRYSQSQKKYLRITSEYGK
jgi:carbonic anhydrase